MPILGDDRNPQGRVDAGNALLAAAKNLKTAPIAAPLKTFAAAHKAFVAADTRVSHADSAVRAQQAIVGERDVAQDEAVDALARALISAGLPRVNPFKPLGFDAPAKMMRMGYAAEAKEARRLADAVKKKKLKALGEAKALEKAARDVESAIAPLAKLLAGRREAIAARDGLELAWETGLAALKLAAKLAEAQGTGRGLYASLFVRTAPSRTPRKKKPATPPATEAPATEAPATE